MPKPLSELPRRATPGKGFDFSFLSDGQPWLLVRGVDFEPEVALATVRRRIRDWAGREGYTPQAVEARPVSGFPRFWPRQGSRPNAL